MRVLLDCDGVLGDFASEVVRFCNLYAPTTGREWTIADATEWDILAALGAAGLQERLDQHMIDTDFCRNMPVYPGAKEFVDRLRRRHDVVIVTSPYSAVPNWCHARIAWLHEHFSISKYDVVFAKRKELILGDVPIDDQIGNCESFDRMASGYAVCLARPWNDGCTSIRALNFAHALELV